MTFTDEVKQELARAPLGDASAVELAALLRYGGALVLGGGGVGLRLELTTVSGATARRAYAALQQQAASTPELRVHAPGGVNRRRRYEVRLDAGADRLARALGLLDRSGRPAPPVVVSGGDAVATTRGAFLAAGSVSAPDRPPHLEIVAHRREAAEVLAATVSSLVDGHVAVSSPDRDERPRVTVKSGVAIGELLAALGATSAFLRWEERRLRRQVRSDATRLANADAANLRRTVDAAAGQVRAVQRLVDRVGWDHLDEDLRLVALARVASPDASLTELGQLVDPPLSRSAVHRRLRRLEQLAARLDDDGDGSAGATDPPVTGRR